MSDTHHACTCIQCCNARTVQRSADPQPEKVIYDLNCRVAELKRAILRAMQSAEDAGILGAEAFGILQGVVHDGIPAPPQPAPEQCFAEGYAWGFGDGILGGGRRDFDALRGWLDRQRRERAETTSQTILNTLKGDDDERKDQGRDSSKASGREGQEPAPQGDASARSGGAAPEARGGGLAASEEEATRSAARGGVSDDLLDRLCATLGWSRVPEVGALERVADLVVLARAAHRVAVLQPGAQSKTQDEADRWAAFYKALNVFSPVSLERSADEACKASESLTSCASDDASREATQVHHERTREWMERSMYGETKVADDDFPEHYERDQTALDDMLAAVRLDTIEECAQLCDTFLDRHKNAEGLKLWPVRECVTKIRALLSVGAESQEKTR